MTPCCACHSPCRSVQHGENREPVGSPLSPALFRCTPPTSAPLLRGAWPTQAFIFCPARSAGQQGWGNSMENVHSQVWKLEFDTTAKCAHLNGGRTAARHAACLLVTIRPPACAAAAATLAPVVLTHTSLPPPGGSTR
jgi:hypothetical protein